MGFTPASQGGTHIVERNLTRLTCVVAAAFGACTVVAVPPARLSQDAPGSPRRVAGLAPTRPVTLNAAVAIAGTR